MELLRQCYHSVAIMRIPFLEIKVRDLALTFCEPVVMVAMIPSVRNKNAKHMFRIRHPCFMLCSCGCVKVRV